MKRLWPMIKCLFTGHELDTRDFILEVGNWSVYPIPAHRCKKCGRYIL